MSLRRMLVLLFAVSLTSGPLQAQETEASPPPQSDQPLPPPPTPEEIEYWTHCSTVPEGLTPEKAKALVLECGGCDGVPLRVALEVGEECLQDCSGLGRPTLPNPIPQTCPGL